MNQIGILSIHCFRTVEAHLLNIEEMRQFVNKNKKREPAYTFIDESITQSMRKKKSLIFQQSQIVETIRCKSLHETTLRNNYDTSLKAAARFIGIMVR